MANSENGGLFDWFAQINSFLRTILGLVIAAGIGVAGWFGFTTYYAGDQAIKELTATKAQLEAKDKEIEQQKGTIRAHAEKIAAQDTEIKHLTAEVKRLDVALRLLKVDHRLARISVLDQGLDAEKNEPFTLIEFVELNDEGQALGEPKQFLLKGDMVFVEYWVVKFEDKYIETADLLRSFSICVFRRLFGEQQKPIDGFVLDNPDGPPAGYARGGEIAEFEKKIWADFWNIANDPEKAKAMGIRAAHSEAPAIKLVKGKRYKLLLRSTGDITITPEDQPEPRVPAN